MLCALTRARERLHLSYARSRMIYGKTSYNRPSRFLDEVPEDCVEWASPRRQSRYDDWSGEDGEETGYGYGGYGGYSKRGSYGGYGSYGARSGGNSGRSGSTGVTGQGTKPAAAAKTGAARPTITGEKTQAAALGLKAGDSVEHRSFGTGVVLTVQPMGGDALLEIAFDGVGTKRLMAKTASSFLKKR